MPLPQKTVQFATQPSPDVRFESSHVAGVDDAVAARAFDGADVAARSNWPSGPR